VQDGTAVVNSQTDSGYALPPKQLHKYQEYHVPMLSWHQLTNPIDVPLKLVEIQYGEQCVEEDIERQ
jgi:mannose-6-phosphate isomerase-like protein (cupin superfamily)